MSDANLIAFGCGVSFIAFAGVYVYMRETFLAAERRRKAEAAEQKTAGEAKRSTATATA